MSEQRQCQYVVMFGQMGFKGLEWSAVDAHYETIEAAEAVAKKYAYWQILEVTAAVIRSSQDAVSKDTTK